MDLSLKDKVAFVTGASKGIGRAVAEGLAKEGANVVLTARNDEPLQVAANEIAAMSGTEVIGMAGDMSKSDEVERCVNATLKKFGRIDILVTCAGSSPGGLLEDLTEEQWMASLNLKFMGYVRSVRAVIPHMRERGEGSIVLVVGNDGLKPSYWEMTAGVANAADINFASSVAEQYGRYGVRISRRRSRVTRRSSSRARMSSPSHRSPSIASPSRTRWPTSLCSSPRRGRPSSTALTSPSTARSARR